MWWVLPKNKPLCQKPNWLKLAGYFFIALVIISCSKPNLKAKLYLASSLSVMLEDIERLADKFEPTEVMFLSSSAIARQADKFEPTEVMFLSSSAIARQVLSGAQCDAMVLADEQWHQLLVSQQALGSDHTFLAHNRLVLVGDSKVQPTDFHKAINQKPQFEKLIVGDEQFNPLGAYTKEALLAYGVYWQIQDKLYRAPSARQASILLKEGLSSWGILYLTDALSDHHHIVAHIDSTKHRPINYPFIPCKDARLTKAQALKQLLFSKEFQQALKNKGFMLP